MDRRQKEKGNTCVRNDKKRRKKRDNRWTNVSAKGHKEGTHACKKKIKFKSFFIQKGYCCSKKKRVQEEGDHENKRSNKKEMKKEVNAKRDEQKQESDQIKDGSKTCKKEKHKTCFVSREIHFKNTDEFSFKKGKKEIARI